MNEATVRALIRRFGGGSVPDGTYGDITVSGGTWSINANAVDTAEIADGAVTFAKMDGAAVVTSGETIAANDNDTTVPTSAAVKDYVDGLVVSGTGGPTATTSGTEVDFVVSGAANRIVVQFDEVSLSGTDHLLVQIGDSGGIASTGYVSGSRESATTSTAGYAVFVGSAARAASGCMEITRVGTSNKWVAFHAVVTGTICSAGGGVKTLSDQITTVRVTRTGTNTFDGGNVSVRYG